MATSMVTARMSATKKEAGSRILATLDMSISQAVNELFDYLLENKELPWTRAERGDSAFSEEHLKQALEWVDTLQMGISPEFKQMTVKEARLRRSLETAAKQVSR